MGINNPPTTYFDFDFFPVSHQLPEVEGEGARGLLIIHQSATEEALNLLQNILNAIGLDMKKHSFRIVTTSQDQLRFVSLQKKLDFDKVLVFGCTPKDLGLHLRWANYQRYSLCEYDFLFADPLDALQEQVPLKKKLWSAIQAWKTDG